MKIVIRRMELGDLSQVVAIENCWSYLSKWGEAGYRAVMSDPRVYTCLVAEDAATSSRPGAIVGMAVVAQLIDDCELCNLVVLPEYVSKHVGSGCCKHALKWPSILKFPACA
jgi:ribosomal protein S18 acetylase RimI-like enzyme